MRAVRTQVGIVGAGPAGLMLGHLLHRRGIETVILEARSREYVEKRIRAGVLEQGTIDLLDEAGVGERMRREGLLHHGIELRFDRRATASRCSELTGGRAVMIYGQTEIVKDLIKARLATEAPLLFEVEDVAVRRPRDRRSRWSAIATRAPSTSCAATSSPAATASTASAVRRSRPAC